METIDLFSTLADQLLAVGMALLRIAVAFSLLPIFSNELIPAMIRNAIFMSLAIIIIVIQPPVPIENFTVQDWFVFVGKEIFIGIAIGIFFGVHLWAFEAAGQIIDVQIGASTAQIFDPISGHQTSLVGEFLGRLANYIFMAAGGLMLLTGGTMESYGLWPLDAMSPNFNLQSVTLFETAFSDFFVLAMLISAPTLIVTFLIDVVMGLINRYAQEFNVFFLSMSLKMFASIFMLSMSITFIVERLISELTQHSSELLPQLQRLLGVIPN